MVFICQDKWQPLLSTVTGVHKYKWLKQNVQGLYPQSALLSTIAEFALKEEPVDVEKMRKCLLKQVNLLRPFFSVLDNTETLNSMY